METASTLIEPLKQHGSPHGSPRRQALQCHWTEERTLRWHLVDMSLTKVTSEDTKRILDVEKALIVLSEAIDALGDAFAIYGYPVWPKSGGILTPKTLKMLGTLKAKPGWVRCVG